MKATLVSAISCECSGARSTNGSGWFRVLALSVLLLLVQIMRVTDGASSADLMKDPYWRSIIINPFKNYSFENDNLHQNPQIRQHFTDRDLLAMNDMVARFLLYPNELMWSTVPEVSEQHPFILFHQRKAGGSSLRDTLFFASKLLNISSFIPCHNADCDIYNFPRNKPYSIYAAHFKWGVQSDLAKFNKTLRTQYSCTTNFRHPISRVESCLYFRFNKQLNNRCVMELPMSDFKDLFHRLDYYGHSCINEPFRALSGLQDELVFDHLMDGIHDHSERRNRYLRRSLRGADLEVERESELLERDRESVLPTVHGRKLVDSLALDVFNLTLQHTLRCPPIILEFAETYDLASERVPMLGQADAFVSDVILQGGGKTRKKCPHLSGEYLAYVEQQSALELMLYDAVVRKVTAQIATRFTDYLFHMQCSLRSTRDYLELEESRGPPIAIVAVDGQTIRTLLEQASGIFTGSVRTRREYTTIFPAENFCGKRMIGIYAEIGSFMVTTTNETDKSASLKYFYSTSVRKCKRGMIPFFSEAVIQVKDPFFEMWKFLRFAQTNSNVSSILSEWSMRSLQEEEEILLSRSAENTHQNEHQTAGPLGGGQQHQKQKSKSHSQRNHHQYSNNHNNHGRRQLQGSIRDESIMKSSLKELLKSTTKDSKFKEKLPNGAAGPAEARDEEEVLQEAEERMHQTQQNSQSSAILSTILKKSNYSTTSTGKTADTASSSESELALARQQEKEKEKEYEFYRDYVSLLVDFHTYSWVFRHYFVAYYNHTKPLSRDELPSFFQKSPQVPSYPKDRFLFYSIESVGEGAYEISDFARKNSHFDEISGNYTSQRWYNEEYDANNNAFLKFLQYTRYEHKLIPKNVQCAYSHVRTPNQIGVAKLREYKAMRQYYQEHPLILVRVKEIVKQWLQVLNLDPEQMLLMYKV